MILQKHKHADLILEYARQKATGELDAGWWVWYYKWASSGEHKAEFPSFVDECTYRFEMTEKHPQYKPTCEEFKEGDVIKHRSRGSKYIVFKEADYNAPKLKLVSQEGYEQSDSRSMIELAKDGFVKIGTLKDFIK